MPRRLLTLLLPFAAALVAAGPAHAGIWTPVDSGLGAGSTQIIGAIDYQSPSRFWFATKSGAISTNTGGGFAVTKNVVGVTFTGIAFQPGTDIGIAVGSNGNIWRSTDAGATWSRSNFTDFTTTYDCNDDIEATSIPTATNPGFALQSVTWGPGNRVFVTGEKGVILRSDNAGGTWTDINRTQIVEPGYPTYRQVSCQVRGTVYDAAPLPVPASTPDNELPIYFFVDEYPYFTSNGLTSAPQQGADLGCSGGQRNLVVDLVNPVRQWSVTARGSDSPCLYRTEDGASYHSVDIPNQGSNSLHETEQIAGAGAGPTLVSVGKGGDILNAVDGQHFYLNRADGATSQNDWYAVSGYDATNFAVGGANGKLLVSSTANTIPDIVPPTGSIAGPDTVTAGQPATFTAVLADEPGGSGIDPTGTSWAADGLPGASGPSVTWTYPSSGSYSITLTFRDLAGNVATATKYVSVQAAVKAPGPQPGPAPKTTKTTSGSVAGGTVSLGSPSVCVPKNGSFSARLSLKRRNAKGVIVTKIYKAYFYVDGHKVKTDKKPPFTQKLTVKKLKAGSTHKLKATAYFKLSNHKTKTKSLQTTFSVCK